MFMFDPKTLHPRLQFKVELSDRWRSVTLHLLHVEFGFFMGSAVLTGVVGISVGCGVTSAPPRLQGQDRLHPTSRLDRLHPTWRLDSVQTERLEQKLNSTEPSRSSDIVCLFWCKTFRWCPIGRFGPGSGASFPFVIVFTPWRWSVESHLHIVHHVNIDQGSFDFVPNDSVS